MHITVAFIFLYIFGGARFLPFCGDGVRHQHLVGQSYMTNTFTQEFVSVLENMQSIAKHCKASRLTEKVGFSYGQYRCGYPKAMATIGT